MKPRPRPVVVIVLVFTGFGVVGGIAGAAVLWWFASQPFDFYTAGYQPLDFVSVRIDSPSPHGYITALVLGGGVLGSAGRRTRLPRRVESCAACIRVGSSA